MGIGRLWHRWTEEKLAILECYLQAFAHPSGWYAIDIFAGAGLNISERPGLRSRGPR
jgi:hypothetical protein